MMWFYTGKGDAGETTLFNGKRVKKDNLILDLIGTIDELNSFIGSARSEIEDVDISNDLLSVQSSLSKMMGLIAGASEQSILDFESTELVDWLEIKIKYFSKEIFNPKAFTFPGDSKPGALLDVCRTVCRRAERKAVGLLDQNIKYQNNLLVVLNRLSSYFYILRLFFEK